ncbi:MAG TPA: DUF58 domain-containing protein [Geminicoccus sp.]|jgi:uncharacterized protein (DUF58 family)|uniref:DUF58 domain-containing protein n=1 Tax=Geminicoccus sp. TaxID=2024832 RepID=UPI002E325C88|nr:DUF58 domain-containing protein [Geminicoccus sp.]HEX2527406.1 DUF58 domain-containing protein [Geminicoccus sp.]
MRSEPIREPLQQRAEAAGLAARLPALQIEARRIAAGILQGVHGRRRAGPGETFWQFRPYQAGDPAHRVDWRQSARGSRLFVREREWEAAQAAWLWCDRSPSMTFRSSHAVPRKIERAAVLMIALGDLLVAGGERVGVLGHDERAVVGKTIPSRILRSLSGTEAIRAEEHLPPARIPGHARTVLFGDFLEPVDTLRSWLEPRVAAGVKGVLLHVVDPAEETFPYTGRMLIEGMEQDGSRLVENAGVLAARYRAVWQAHRDSLTEEARRRDWVHLVHRTDQPASMALIALWQALALPTAGSA